MTSPIGWEKTFTLTSGQYKVSTFAATSRGNLIAVAYEATVRNKKGIYAVISLNNGTNFFGPVFIADSIADDTREIKLTPHIAVAGNGHLVIVWQDYDPEDAGYHIFYALSSNMGATWSVPVKIQVATEMEFIPRAYYDNRNFLHIFYHALQGSKFFLYHITSNTEYVFDKSRVLFDLSSEIRGAFFPSIALSGKYMFLVWQGKRMYKGMLNDDLYFVRSSNYGDSWSSPDRITDSNANDAAPSLLVHEKNLYCVYQNNDNKNWEIKFIKGIEWGENWSKIPITVSDTNANCYFPSVVANDDQFLFFWYDNRDGNNKIYMRKYNFNDEKFSETTLVSDNRESADKQVPLISGKKIVCFWSQGTRLRGKYSDLYVAPPRVFSRTHNPLQWSRSETADIEWSSPKDASGIAGYATIVNKFKYFNPTVQNITGNIRKTIIPFLEDGVSYFHIRAIDGAGNYSRTIHYKLQVSKTPLGLPIIESPTHPEGEAVKKESPVFRWSIDSEDRVKGYLYNFSQNYPHAPKKFIDTKTIDFKNVSEGRYFFTLQAVDKTNRPGRIATYEIVVGKAGKLDTKVYEAIAKRNAYLVAKESIQVPKKLAKPLPRAIITLPLKKDLNWSQNSITAQMKVSSQRQYKDFLTEGFAVKIGNTKQDVPRTINASGTELHIPELRNGTYVISARVKYSYLRNNKRVYKWSPVTYVSFNVIIPEEISFLNWDKKLEQQISRKWILVLTSICVISLLVLSFGYGTKIQFYLQSFGYRLKSTIKLLFS